MRHNNKLIISSSGCDPACSTESQQLQQPAHHPYRHCPRPAPVPPMDPSMKLEGLLLTDCATLELNYLPLCQHRSCPPATDIHLDLVQSRSVIRVRLIGVAQYNIRELNTSSESVVPFGATTSTVESVMGSSSLPSSLVSSKTPMTRSSLVTKF